MYKIGKTDNTLCTFCENVETIYHLLWDFPKVLQLQIVLEFATQKQFENTLMRKLFL